MTKEEIFYRTQRVQYYELFTNTMVFEKKKPHTIYGVVWHTLTDAIKEEITKEEYEVLLKGLENDK